MSRCESINGPSSRATAVDSLPLDMPASRILRGSPAHPMMRETQRNQLHQFFGAYFHEDWSLGADSPDEVVSAFIRERGDARELEQLSSGIMAFVEQYPEEDELGEALIKELGCSYLPLADGISTRSWLLGVAAKLKLQGNA